jgi:Cof subfamily protein (haloacid dehalogenase superfamily)
VFVPRLVATDLDGTLLRSDLSISDRTLGTFARLERSGIGLVFVTGRPVRWLEPVLAVTGRRGTVVCANGAVIADGRTAQVVESWPIPPDVLREVTTRLRAGLPGACFAVEREPAMVREEGYPVRWDAVWAPAIVDYEELVAAPVYKLLVRAQNVDFTRLWETCVDRTDGLATPTHSGSRGMIEIAAAGVTKATGLAWAAERAGVGQHAVIAFGDMPNDVPMLRWAGVGVAVADAHPDAVAAADVVTLANDADGVAVYLDDLLDAAEATFA